VAGLARRWRALAELLDTVPGVQAPELLPFVLPSLELPEIGKRAAGAATAAAEAAKRSSVQLWNPAKSGMEIHVTRIWLRQGTAGRSQLKMSATELPNLGTATQILDRRPRRRDAAGEVRQDALASTGAIFASFRIPATDTTFEIKDLDVILPEEQSLLVAPDADNVAMEAAFWWFELPLT